MKINEMSRLSKIVLFAIGLAAALYGGSAFAGMRCQGQIIEIGDPIYVVQKYCGEPVYTHTVGRQIRGDEGFAYYEKDGRTIELHFIDGHLYSIGGDENIH